MTVPWYYILLAFWSSFLLGAMVMALCVAARDGDEMAQLAHEERLAVERAGE